MAGYLASILSKAGLVDMVASRRWLCYLVLAGMCLIPAGVSADSYVGGIPLTTVKEGTVSGGVFIDAYPGFATSAEQVFALPKYSSIQWARLYVVVYCGHMQNNYEVLATTDFNGGDGYKTLATEQLNVPYSFPGEGGNGPVTVNSHCTRVTSDYVMWYDVKDQITGQSVSAKVRTEKPPGYKGTFDGRIKTITLVVAYNDGDQDKVLYWVNEGHDADSHYSEDFGDKYTGETDFSTANIPDDWDNAVLSNVYLASNNGVYTFNTNELDAQAPRGQYFGIDTWDVTSDLLPGEDSTFTYQKSSDSTGPYGAYFKLFLAALSVKYAAAGGGSGGIVSDGSAEGDQGVTITSVPDRSRIYVDDSETGALTNTTRYDISPGRHVFRVEKEGYKDPAPQVVTIPEGKSAAIHFVLQPVMAALRVLSAPAGAQVAIDGNQTGMVTPIVIGNLSEGSHIVSLSLPGYNEYTANISTRSGDTTDLTVTLSASAGGAPAGETAQGDPAEARQAFMQIEESGYSGMALTPVFSGTVEGNVSITTVSDYTGLVYPGESHSFPLTFSLPENAKVKAARLWLYTTWSHDDRKREGKVSTLTTFLNGQPLPADAFYADQKASGIYSYPAETYAYDVTQVIESPGTYNITVRNDGGGADVTALYGAALLVVYARTGDPVISYWVTEGSDSVYSHPQFNITDSDAVTTAAFDGRIDLGNTSAARMTAISTAASGLDTDANLILFNGQEWRNLLSGGSSDISVGQVDVRPYLRAWGNTGSISSERGSLPKGDYMENRGLVLVLTRGTPPPGVPVGAGNEAASIPIISRIAIVAGDVVQRTGRWTLFLAGLGESLLDSEVPARSGEEPVTGAYQVSKTGLSTPINGEVPTTPVPVLTAIATQVVPDYSTTVISPPFGGIYVSSYPGEADIYVDGRKTRFITPSVIYGLKEGPHTVSVKKDKNTYPESSRECYVEGGWVVPVSFTQDPLITRTLPLEIKGFSSDQITINGQAPPVYPGSSLEVMGQDAFVTVLHNASFLSYTIPSILQTGGLFSIREDSPHRYPWVEVISNPAGAEVIVDGWATGAKTPVVLRNVSDGIHRISVSLPGYLPAEGTYTFTDMTRDLDYSLQFNLERYQYGTLTVDSVPAGAKVYLYGKDAGMKTPVVMEYLAMGSYDMRVTLGNVTKSREVMVLPQRNVTVSFDLQED